MYDVIGVWNQRQIYLKTLNPLRPGAIVGLTWNVKNIHIIKNKNEENPNEYYF
jgi:hypothetical protein